MSKTAGILTRKLPSTLLGSSQGGAHVWGKFGPKNKKQKLRKGTSTLHPVQNIFFI
jgi:hypothetical protein